MKKDNSKLIAILLVIITIIVVVVSYVINSKNKEDADINIVTNYSNFYTVNSCLYRVMTYISAQDSESLMLILDDSYEKENYITKENILNFFPKVGNSPTFVSKKMYYQKLNDNITKYYVYGYIEENMIYDDNNLIKPEYSESYFIVYLDSDNKTFSIEPYSGEVFKDGENDEK